MLEKQRTIARRHSPIGVAGGVADDARLGLDDAAAGPTFGQLPHQYLTDPIAGESLRIDWQLRAGEQAAEDHPYGGQDLGHPLDPWRARRPRLERIAEILGLAGHLAIAELHDTHGVRRPPVVRQDIFGDPEVASTGHPPLREAFAVRLRGARRLDLPSPPDALARLRIVEHRVLPVDLVLRLEVIRVGGGPVTIQSCSSLSVFHI